MNKLHWAFIMDGNGRWAKLHGFQRKSGHVEGVKTVEKVVDFCLNCGEVGVVSLYVFSTENWDRPAAEVKGLLSLAEKYVSRVKTFLEKDVRVVFSSSYDKLPVNLVKSMRECEEKTKNCKKMVLNLCFNYGGREEILHTAKVLAEKGELKDADEEVFLKNMYNDLPCPDLILRTGGQMRLSNFLLFQSAYTELFFSDTLWPDLTEEELNGVLDAFKHRVRNFGKII